MNIDKCDPEIMCDIVADFTETMAKPRLVTDPLPFTIVDDEDGTETGYSMNTNSTWYVQMQSIDKFIESESNRFNYFWRFSSVMSFIFKNEEQLTRNGEIRSTEQGEEIHTRIYRAAATCKIGKRGFKFKDMITEMKKYQ